MKKELKIIILAIAGLALLLCAVFEYHRVFSLSPENQNALEINGFDFVETASYDGFTNNEGKLFDVQSLTPELLQLKDCST